jgi:hypothetical protein
MSFQKIPGTYAWRCDYTDLGVRCDTKAEAHGLPDRWQVANKMSTGEERHYCPTHWIMRPKGWRVSSNDPRPTAAPEGAEK